MKSNNQVKPNLLVITSYPPKGKTHGDKVVGIASYAKNTLLGIKSGFKKLKITVLAEKLPGENSSYKEKDIEIKRVWERNSFLTFPTLFNKIRKKYKKTENILIEFELAMYGEKLYLLPFPLFLLGLRLLKKKTTIVLHQVVPDINDMHGHMNITPDSFYALTLNIFIQVFYSLTLRLSDKVIVFEEDLKDKLKKMTNQKNIVVIPHGVEKFATKKSKREVRKMLGIPQNKFVILSFGFIAWYKGTDWLVNAYKDKIAKSNPNNMLIIAGGPNPNHMGKRFYQRYIENIKREARQNDILVTDFIPEKMIPLYYKAADIVVFPYRSFMSASGPLSIAFSFEKPFLVSDKLESLFDTKDIKYLLEKNKIKEESFCFDQNGELAKKIKLFQRNQKFKKQVTMVSRELKNKEIGQS